MKEDNLMESKHRSERFSRRLFLRSAAAAVGGLTLAACGAAPSTGSDAANTSAANTSSSTPVPASGAAASAPAAATKTNITLWYWGSEVFQKATVDLFNASRPNVFVKLEKLTQPDTHKNLLTSIAAGGGAPDVCAIEVGAIGSFAAKGGLTDLLQAPFNAGQFQNDMVAYKWAHGSTADGRLIAMPWDCGAAGLWYRADLFDKAGIASDPAQVQARIKTWDDWMQLGEEVRQKLPETTFFTDAYQDIFYPAVEQQGHGYFDGNKLLFEEKGLEPIKLAADARRRGLDTTIDWWSPEWANAIKQNAFATMAIACWAQGFLTLEQPQTIGQWRVIRAPGGDYNWGGSFLAIPEQSTNKEAAWEFIQFVCASKEGQNSLFKAEGIYPAYKPAWTDPVYDEPVAFFGGQRTFRLWAEIADNVPPSQPSPNDQQANDILNNQLTKVRKEDKDPLQALKDAEIEAIARIRGITA
jgi:multiple sugar transport system substrate-binding protein